MKQRLTTILRVAGLTACISCALPGTGGPRGSEARPAESVAFATPASMERLSRSRHSIDFFHLVNQFEGQTNRAFCGPTAAAIVLNALRIDNPRIEKPEDPSLLPAEISAMLPAGVTLLYRRYTPHNLFNATTAAVKTRAEVLGRPRSPGAKPDPGLQLRQLHALLVAAGLDSQIHIVDDGLSDAAIRKGLAENLATANDYVIVNYSRPALGQEGGGHISPLGAYDEHSDSFLILDVNPNGHRWVWAPATALFHAMRTRDTVENRGYLCVREGQP